MRYSSVLAFALLGLTSAPLDGQEGTVRPDSVQEDGQSYVSPDWAIIPSFRYQASPNLPNFGLWGLTVERRISGRFSGAASLHARDGHLSASAVLPLYFLAGIINLLECVPQELKLRGCIPMNWPKLLLALSDLNVNVPVRPSVVLSPHVRVLDWELTSESEGVEASERFSSGVGLMLRGYVWDHFALLGDVALKHFWRDDAQTHPQDEGGWGYYVSFGAGLSW